MLAVPISGVKGLCENQENENENENKKYLQNSSVLINILSLPSMHAFGLFMYM